MQVHKKHLFKFKLRKCVLPIQKSKNRYGMDGERLKRQLFSQCKGSDHLLVFRRRQVLDKIFIWILPAFRRYYFVM